MSNLKPRWALSNDTDYPSVTADYEQLIANGVAPDVAGRAVLDRFDTYEWDCEACGTKTLLGYAGGVFNCECAQPERMRCSRIRAGARTDLGYIFTEKAGAA